MFEGLSQDVNFHIPSGQRERGTSSSASVPWYIYIPHWSVKYPHGTNSSTIRLDAVQATFLKRRTSLSWELGENEKAHVRAGVTLLAVALSEVLDPAELRRHSGSQCHRVVQLTEDSLQCLVAEDARWYVYGPHWQLNADVLVARENTWLKRSCDPSRELPGHLKVNVSAGEAVSLLSLPQPASGLGGSSYQFAMQHLVVLLTKGEVLRLVAAAPRAPLCKYFPADRGELLADVSACFLDNRFGPGCVVPTSLTRGLRQRAAPPLALLVPHGGYCNSGFVAAHGFRLLAEIPSSAAIIVGTNHKAWHKFSLSKQRWSTPLGCMEPDTNLISELEAAGYPLLPAAHADEHSIENQLPFLQTVCPGIRIAPVGVGRVTLSEAEALAATLAMAVERHGALLLGTTDFSHEGPSYGGPAIPMEQVTALTRQKDKPLLEAVLRMDADELLRLGAQSSMCGAGAAAVLLLTCKLLDLHSSELLRYLVNTEVTPCGSTTGFASFVFKRRAL